MWSRKMDVPCWNAMNVIAQLQSIAALEGRFYVAGGLVPWLIAGRDSARMHGDVDLVVSRHDMPIFRQIMYQQGYYNPNADAQVVWPHIGTDYGIDVLIDDVMVNIAPFEVVPDGIVQRNASYAHSGGVAAPVTLFIPDLKQSEYVTHTLWRNESLLGHYPLALVYATKQITNRPKDHIDCRELDRLGVCESDVLYYLHVLQRIQLNRDAKISG